MQTRLSLKIALSLLVTAFAAGAHAAPPDLALLAFPGATKKEIIHIPAKTGKYTPKTAGKAQRSWLLLSGAPLQAATRPDERVIRLFRVIENTPTLLCTIVVKYFPDNGKWQPLYRMEERMMLARTGDHLVPVPSGMGDPDLNLMVGSSLPNVEGYFDRIEFGLPSAPIAIDSWEVQ
jgi:hypothetical protein